MSSFSARLISSRQNLPHLAGSSAEKTLLGAYVLQDPSSKAQLVIAASGSEVSLAVEAAKILEGVSVCIIKSHP